MSRFFICEIEELKKQGIEVIKTEKEYRENGEEHTTIEVTRELDFSAHDKVFEDKIAKLEKKNKDLQSCFTQREQDSTDMIMKLKQEKSDKNEKIAELACENESLKQRIAELESKETEKPKKYITVIVAKEINGQTYVTLDDFMSVVNDLQAEIGT